MLDQSPTAEQVCQFRQRHGLSREQAAASIGRTKFWIRNIEQGQQIMAPYDWLRLVIRWDASSRLRQSIERLLASA